MSDAVTLGITQTCSLTFSGFGPKLDASDLQTSGGYAWIAVPPPSGGWDLTRAPNVNATVTNTGSKPAATTLWVVSANGWTLAAE